MGEPLPPARGARDGVRKDAKTGKSAYDPRGVGAAWSHGFLNQKPWHPLSFRNQQRKYEAEQRHIEQQKRLEEAKAEFEAEQEQFKSLTYLSTEDQKKYRDRQQIAFMYMRPPGLEAALKKEEQKGKAEEAERKLAEDDGKERMVVGRSSSGETGRNTVAQGNVGSQGFSESGPMAKMLQSRAIWESHNKLQYRKMSPPRGGFDASASNQQFVVPTEEELNEGGEHSKTPKTSKKERKREARIREVKEAEAVLKAAGYDVDQLTKSFKKNKHKRKKQKKERTDTKEHRRTGKTDSTDSNSDVEHDRKLNSRRKMSTDKGRKRAR